MPKGYAIFTETIHDERSPKYQAIAGERHAAAQADAVIVAGFEMPGA